MARITIFDTTLRDGERSPGSSMTAGEKLRMAHELAELGVDVIEAGLAARSPEDAQAIRRISAEVSGPVVAALARAHAGDVERAAEALAAAGRPRIHVFIATSDIHLERGLGISRSECLERIEDSVRRARELCADVEFSAEDAFRTDMGFLARAVETAIAAGATTINIPDTVGYALPTEVRATFLSLREHVPALAGCVLSVHCHDDLGMAVANSLAAIEAGARQVECTINGIGERAGNAALEEVVMALAVRRDGIGHETGIRSERLYRTSRLLTYLTGIEPSPNKAIVGRNAFAHESGPYDPGLIDDPRAYAFMRPEMVGAPRTGPVTGEHSGRPGLEARYQALGYALTPEELERVAEAFTELADRKKTVLDEDLLSILHHGVMEDVPARYRLADLHVRCGAEVSEASVVVEREDHPPLASEGVGDGPIAAAFAAMDRVLDFRVVLRDLTIRSSTPGEDALGEVSIHAVIDGHTFTGRAAHTDVVRASAQAYLHAINKAAAARVLEEQHFAATADAWGV